MMKKLILSLIASIIFIILLLSIYYIHVTYFKVDVVFYSALFDSLLAASLATILVFLLSYFRWLSGFERFLLTMIWLLGGYAFAISVPTVIDRSLSFYILEKIQQRGGGIKKDGFDYVFTEEYLKEHRLVDVRLTEQLESGTIVIDNGCVKLTPKGIKIASFGRYFRQHFLPKQRLLMGEYSDDLTNPFRGNSQGDNYECN